MMMGFCRLRGEGKTFQEIIVPENENRKVKEKVPGHKKQWQKKNSNAKKKIRIENEKKNEEYYSSKEILGFSRFSFSNSS